MSQSENLLGHLASGQSVIQRARSTIERDIEECLSIALSKIDARGRRFFCEEISFDYPIGRTKCVKTTEDDTITFVTRYEKPGPTRFVKFRDPEASNKMYIILKRASDGTSFVLIKASIGEATEPEPWDENNFFMQADPAAAREKSIKFWENHALVYHS
ncbi:MAG: hypothetical protein WCQ49_01460 [Candidatus Saccharibacteria bacterium]